MAKFSILPVLSRKATVPNTVNISAENIRIKYDAFGPANQDLVTINAATVEFPD